MTFLAIAVTLLLLAACLAYWAFTWWKNDSTSVNSSVDAHNRRPHAAPRPLPALKRRCLALSDRTSERLVRFAENPVADAPPRPRPALKNGSFAATNRTSKGLVQFAENPVADAPPRPRPALKNGSFAVTSHTSKGLVRFVENPVASALPQPRPALKSGSFATTSRTSKGLVQFAKNPIADAPPQPLSILKNGSWALRSRTSNRLVRFAEDVTCDVVERDVVSRQREALGPEEAATGEELVPKSIHEANEKKLGVAAVSEKEEDQALVVDDKNLTPDSIQALDLQSVVVVDALKTKKIIKNVGALEEGLDRELVSNAQMTFGQAGRDEVELVDDKQVSFGPVADNTDQASKGEESLIGGVVEDQGLVMVDGGLKAMDEGLKATDGGLKATDGGLEVTDGGLEVTDELEDMLDHDDTEEALLTVEDFQERWCELEADSSHPLLPDNFLLCDWEAELLVVYGEPQDSNDAIEPDAEVVSRAGVRFEENRPLADIRNFEYSSSERLDKHLAYSFGRTPALRFRKQPQIIKLLLNVAWGGNSAMSLAVFVQELLRLDPKSDIASLLSLTAGHFDMGWFSRDGLQASCTHLRESLVSFQAFWPSKDTVDHIDFAHKLRAQTRIPAEMERWEVALEHLYHALLEFTHLVYVHEEDEEALEKLFDEEDDDNDELLCRESGKSVVAFSVAKLQTCSYSHTFLSIVLFCLETKSETKSGEDGTDGIVNQDPIVIEEPAELSPAVDRQGLEAVAQGLDALVGGLRAADGGLDAMDGGLGVMDEELLDYDDTEDALLTVKDFQEHWCKLEVDSNHPLLPDDFLCGYPAEERDTELSVVEGELQDSANVINYEKDHAAEVAPKARVQFEDDLLADIRNFEYSSSERLDKHLAMWFQCSPAQRLCAKLELLIEVAWGGDSAMSLAIFVQKLLRLDPNSAISLLLSSTARHFDMDWFSSRQPASCTRLRESLVSFQVFWPLRDTVDGADFVGELRKLLGSVTDMSHWESILEHLYHALLEFTHLVYVQEEDEDALEKLLNEEEDNDVELEDGADGVVYQNPVVMEEAAGLAQAVDCQLDGGLEEMDVDDKDAIVSDETGGPEVAVDQEQFCGLEAMDDDDDDLPVPQPDSEEDYDQDEIGTPDQDDFVGLDAVDDDDDNDLPVPQPDSEEDYELDENGTQDLEEQNDFENATIQRPLRRSSRLASLPKVNYKQTANRCQVPLRRSPRLARLPRVNYKV